MLLIRLTAHSGGRLCTDLHGEVGGDGTGEVNGEHGGSLDTHITPYRGGEEHAEFGAENGRTADSGKVGGPVVNQDNVKGLRAQLARLDPPRPDDPGVMYDPEIAKGEAAMRAYQQAYWERCHQADEAWARQYPGVEFRRLTDRLSLTPPSDEDSASD